MTLEEYLNKFKTIKEASAALGIPYSTMRRWLQGVEPIHAWQLHLKNHGITWAPRPVQPKPE